MKELSSIVPHNIFMDLNNVMTIHSTKLRVKEEEEEEEEE